MRRLSFVVWCVLLGLGSGRGDRCDIYVANAGAGNCIYVLFSADGDDGSASGGSQKGLWVDCGFGHRGFPPPKNQWGCPHAEVLDKIVGDYFFGGSGAVSPLEEGMASPKDTMLWITHLHDDHVCKVESIGDGREQGKSCAGLNVGAVVVGVRDSADLQQPSSGPGSISKILNYPGAVKVKV